MKWFALAFMAFFISPFTLAAQVEIQIDPATGFVSNGVTKSGFSNTATNTTTGKAEDDLWLWEFFTKKQTYVSQSNFGAYHRVPLTDQVYCWPRVEGLPIKPPCDNTQTRMDYGSEVSKIIQVDNDIKRRIIALVEMDSISPSKIESYLTQHWSSGNLSSVAYWEIGNESWDYDVVDGESKPYAFENPNGRKNYASTQLSKYIR